LLHCPESTYVRWQGEFKYLSTDSIGDQASSLSAQQEIRGVLIDWDVYSLCGVGFWKAGISA